jgi:hypothetical protein
MEETVGLSDMLQLLPEWDMLKKIMRLLYNELAKWCNTPYLFISNLAGPVYVLIKAYHKLCKNYMILNICVCSICQQCVISQFVIKNGSTTC